MTLQKLLIELKTLRGNSIIAPFIKEYQVYEKSWTGEYDLLVSKDRLYQNDKILDSKVLRTYCEGEDVHIEIDYAPHSGKYEFYVRVSDDWFADKPKLTLNKHFQNYKSAMQFVLTFIHNNNNQEKDVPRIIIVRVDKKTKEEKKVFDSFDTNEDRR